MERNNREFVKRQYKDGASEMSKDTHVDQNTEFVQGGNSPYGMQSDTDDATHAAVADNDVEKFAHQEYPKHEHKEEQVLENDVEKFSIDHLATPDIEDIAPADVQKQDPKYVPNPGSSEER